MSRLHRVGYVTGCIVKSMTLSAVIVCQGHLCSKCLPMWTQTHQHVSQLPSLQRLSHYFH